MAQTIVAKAEAILWTELLWEVELSQRRSVDLAAIQDNLSKAQRGASFLSPALLKEGRDWVFAQLASAPAARSLFKKQDGQGARESQQGQQG